MTGTPPLNPDTQHGDDQSMGFDDHHPAGTRAAGRRRNTDLPTDPALLRADAGTITAEEYKRRHGLDHQPTDWLDALGHPVPLARRQKAHDLLVREHVAGSMRITLVLGIVCREIEHDEPDRALRYLRSLIGTNETLVLMVAATLAAPA